MNGDRASMFEQDGDLDLGEFKPKPPARPEQVRGVAEQVGFHSREPKAAPAVPIPVVSERREPRRYRTGRNVQLNLKVRQEAVDAFYKLADEQGWVLGEAFERAVAALDKELQEASQ
ncbi:hypothetical protein [Siccirubricoccus sp. G192]|uniref:hypothetical protein n=1 Tax=Siccirubricoccus sp. G192 TaxID=2849651 RepID=UPI001C2B7EF1|nr:hypothetical protein [Siccirubricoccus sp. G192]MBV1800607.1 hypothetical protein [Siccirubricoccus sp. G192]MBV1800671.1 hypothetical protein [Siccirubricoccus sp. G192]